ncbi:MAG: c-type cytochrome biogenesis protein CcmI [Pseudomonadota bacterium]
MMSEFGVGALALVALAALFLCLPRLFLRQRQDLDNRASNRDWFQRREAELTPGSGDSGVDIDLREELLRDAQLRMLEEGGEAVSAAGAGGKRYLAPALLGLLAMGSILVYWNLGAVPDVQLKQALDAVVLEGQPSDYQRLMLAVEDRVRQRPNNPYYLAMLGRYYMTEGEFEKAYARYSELALLAPNDAGSAALAAQAGFLASDRRLSEENKLLAERALALDPQQPTALSLLGVASYESGEFQAAISYWQRLLAMEAPDSPTAEMIKGVITRAREAMDAGGSPTRMLAAESQAVSADNAGVSVRLTLADGATASPEDTVFVFARNPTAATRMPVAVQRLSVSALPVTVRLDDAASMAGQKISALASVDLVARISPSGQPGEQNATYQAQKSGVVPAEGEQVHTLVLAPVGES